MDDQGRLEVVLRYLLLGFPDVPPDAITMMLGDSYLTVVTAAGKPLVDEAERLATLRLEVRTRHPSFAPGTADESVPSVNEDRAMIRAAVRRVSADAQHAHERAAAAHAQARQLMDRLRVYIDAAADRGLDGDAAS